MKLKWLAEARAFARLRYKVCTSLEAPYPRILAIQAVSSSSLTTPLAIQRLLLIKGRYHSADINEIEHHACAVSAACCYAVVP
ncbi:hypothetical protein [Cupriavidus sp. YR651]|uniref:hypothetical protein n=1 Tax=Cupriavidus sp. YR651 TaxID=1855315 RepID=UPI00115FFFFD|nr:hypothetical protein [Cupriavidus sp. YR651]